MSLTFLIKKTLPKTKSKPELHNKLFWDLDRDGMSQSMLMEFLACRERARLAYKEGWATVGTSHPITFGSLFHACLEKIFRHARVEGNVLEMNFKNIIENVIADYKEETIAEREWTLADAEETALDEGYLNVLLPEYVNQHWKKDKKHEWILVEDEFMNTIDDVIFRGKFDRVSRNVHGEVWLHETKTKYIFDPAIQDRLSFDPQVMIYILNYKLSYKEMPAGFVYDMIQRPRIRRKQNESLKEFIARLKRDVDGTYFKRIRMRVTQADFDYWYKNEFKHMVREFREWAIGSSPTYRNPASCETRYGSCKFVKVCGLKDYTGLYQRKRVFPELEGKVKVQP